MRHVLGRRLRPQEAHLSQKLELALDLDQGIHEIAKRGGERHALQVANTHLDLLILLGAGRHARGGGGGAGRRRGRGRRLRLLAAAEAARSSARGVVRASGRSGSYWARPPKNGPLGGCGKKVGMSAADATRRPMLATVARAAFTALVLAAAFDAYTNCCPSTNGNVDFPHARTVAYGCRAPRRGARLERRAVLPRDGRHGRHDCTAAGTTSPCASTPSSWARARPPAPGGGRRLPGLGRHEVARAHGGVGGGPGLRAVVAAVQVLRHGLPDGAPHRLRRRRGQGQRAPSLHRRVVLPPELLADARPELGVHLRAEDDGPLVGELLRDEPPHLGELVREVVGDAAQAERVVRHVLALVGVVLAREPVEAGGGLA